MVTDAQVGLLRQKLMEEKTQETAAATAGMSLSSWMRYLPLLSISLVSPSYRSCFDDNVGDFTKIVEGQVLQKPIPSAKVAKVVSTTKLDGKTAFGVAPANPLKYQGIFFSAADGAVINCKFNEHTSRGIHCSPERERYEEILSVQRFTNGQGVLDKVVVEVPTLMHLIFCYQHSTIAGLTYWSACEDLGTAL